VTTGTKIAASRDWLDAIDRVFHWIPDLATPPQVESALRAILADPDVRMYWWDWELERYVDVFGGHAEPTASGSLALTRLEYETRRIGAIVHDARLLDTPGFTESFVPLIRIAMERDRLHRDLVTKLDQLKASRLRIVQAGDEERRRLERNLHDGAQQRLTAALIPLRSLASKLGETAELRSLAEGAIDELEGAIADLRELARGLHPPLLAREGLGAAIRAGARRAALPVELALDLPRRLPPALEAAAYYVAAEAVTNAVKHARASGVWITVAEADGALTVDVRDDGIGGACIDCDSEATGLGGLNDRVEALEGVLEVDSPEGKGTRLTATFPVRDGRP
jgi:signal transduction histidine kinase